MKRYIFCLTIALSLLLGTTPAIAQPDTKPAVKATPKVAVQVAPKTAPKVMIKIRPKIVRKAPVKVATKAAPAPAVVPVATPPVATVPTPAVATTPVAPTTETPVATAATTDTPTGKGEQSWWQALLYDVVFKLIVPIFLPVLMVLIFWLLRKFGIKVDLETLDKLAGQAANYAEHKGKVWLKENEKKSSGAQKEDWAWELVEAVDSKLKGKEKARNKLRALILAKVAEAEKQSAEAAPAPNGVPVPAKD